jgi:glycine cleavage system transcriptional repressor
VPASFALTAVGRDRPGIVAAVTEVLLEHGANIEDSRMALLRGHFAMALIVSVPDAADVSALREGLDAVAERLELEAIALAPVEQLAGEEADATHLVTVYGADHPGIVHGIATALAAAGVNILDLSTRLAGGPGEEIYAMLMEVHAPAGTDVDALLVEVAARLAVEVSVRRLEHDAL